MNSIPGIQKRYRCADTEWLSCLKVESTER